ncbi:EAL domain-containing protein [Methyloceanibacter sp.]|uniref:EAL domain-containing protein n=1 Tax=Methyloceanibacter sp. TaxID=1965321 RepID=UPI002B7CC16F|nr:EAL domain-containing protein [Methyloceanibacter sp.]
MTTKRASSGGPGLLDTIVLLAMAVTASAVAAGLVVHSGIATIPAVIAAAALYMVMAASYLTLARSSGRPESGTERLHEIEQALEIIDGDLQRIDRVEDELGRLGVLSQRVDELDRAVGDQRSSTPPVDAPPPEHFTAGLEDVHTKIETLRADLQAETRNQREKISKDLRQLETLIVKLTGELTARASASATVPARASAPAPFAAEVKAALEESLDEPAPKISAPPPPPPKLAANPKEEDFTADFSYDEIAGVSGAVSEAPKPQAGDEALELEAEIVEEEFGEIAIVAEAEEEAIDSGAAADEDVATSAADPGMLETLRQAIEGSRIDLYLQPIVTLPERKLRYYEGYTRIKTAADDLVLPGAYVPVAEDAGIVPLIDNVLLVKSVQVLRRLKPQSKVKGIFCNISMKSLLDPDFFPELVEFMEENSGLSGSLVFEISQKAMDGLTRGELAALDTLGALGYGFSLDHVGDLDVDFASLRERHFRFVKIAATIFLDDMEARGAALPAAEMKAYIEDFDLKLIVEKVEKESAVARLLDYGVELVQGHLFGEPKLMSPAAVRDLEDADAA